MWAFLTLRHWIQFNYERATPRIYVMHSMNRSFLFLFILSVYSCLFVKLWHFQWRWNSICLVCFFLIPNKLQENPASDIFYYNPTPSRPSFHSATFLSETRWTSQWTDSVFPLFRPRRSLNSQIGPLSLPAWQFLHRIRLINETLRKLA